MQINWPEGLNAAIFLRDYWQKKPLLIRGAFPHFDNPISVDELAGLSMETGVNSRLVLEDSTPPWRCLHGPFDEALLTSLPDQGWSLLISDIEKVLPDFIDYLDPFRFIPDWRIDDLMISAAPDGGSVGAHVDAYDVFLLQTQGQRRWSYELSARVPGSEPFIPEIDLRILQNFTADLSEVLACGDLLYLPPGFAHHGVAEGDDCMTWSVGFRAPAETDLISAFSDDIIARWPEHQRYGDPQLSEQSNPGEIAESAKAEIHALIKQALTADSREAFDRWLGRYLTEIPLGTGPNPVEFAPDFEAILQALEQGKTLRRRTDVRFSWSDCGTQCFLFAGGFDWPCQSDFAALLCQHYDYDVELLAKPLADPTALALIQQLITSGFIEFENEDNHSV